MRVGASCGGFEIWVKCRDCSLLYDLLHSWQFQSSAQASGIWEDFSILNFNSPEMVLFWSSLMVITLTDDAAWKENKTNTQPSQLRRVFQACSSWHLHSWQHLNFKLHSRLKLIKSNLSCLSRDFLVLIKVSFKTLEALMWPRVALMTCDDVPAMWVFSPQRSCDGCRHQFWHNWVSYHSFIKIDLYKLKSNWSFLSGKSEKLND